MKQTSEIETYWRQRLPRFPLERPEGFDERSWDMLSRHVLDGMSMGELAQEYGVSKGRVQALLKRASERLKERVGE